MKNYEIIMDSYISIYALVKIYRSSQKRYVIYDNRINISLKKFFINNFGDTQGLFREQFFIYSLAI